MIELSIFLFFFFKFYTYTFTSPLILTIRLLNAYSFNYKPLLNYVIWSHLYNIDFFVLCNKGKNYFIWL